MDIDDIKQEFLSGIATSIKTVWRLKDPKIIEYLDNIYKINISTVAKFYLYINDMSGSDITCDMDYVKHFKSLNVGFMKYCGNQSKCNCNKRDSKKRLADLPQEEWNRRSNKRKITNNKKYGYDFASQHPSIKEKTMDTCMKLYGGKSPSNNKSVQEKKKITCLTNYGVMYPQQNPSIKEKTEQTFITNYGVSRPAKNPTIINKMRDTMLERYGNVSGSPEIIEQRLKTYKSTLYDRLIKTKSHIPMFTKHEYCNTETGARLKWKCHVCNTIFLQSIIPGRDIRCFSCRPKRESSGECILREWFMKHNLNFTINDRSIITGELDFYFPDHNIAIEYNGIYWHSELAGRDRHYHINKLNKCEELGINLIQIFEHELEFKYDNVISRLRHLFNFNNNVVGARTLMICELNIDEVRSFLTSNHIQGYVSGKYKYGLKDNDELYAVMTFSKARYNKVAQWEMIRYAVRNNTSVPGGASKLFKHAKHQLSMTSVVSYADKKWGKGELYENLGFNLSHASKPSYWYFKNINEIYNRIKFQKHKLPQELHYLGNEWKIMQFLGYNRYWDCGNNVWLFVR